MIYSDGIHIISSISLEHLHQECKKMGLKRHWFHNGRFPHYDIPKRQRATFLQENNIQKVSSREIIQIIKQTDYFN